MCTILHSVHQYDILNIFCIQLPVTAQDGTFGIVPSRWLHAMLLVCVWHVINSFALDLDLLCWL